MSDLRHSNERVRADHRNRTQLSDRRRAFTLLEILVVILIIGILAAAASLALLTRVRAATLDDLTRRIAFLDAAARHTARRSGHEQRIVIDLDKGLIVSQELGTSDDLALGTSALDTSNWAQRIQLPHGFQVDHAWQINQASDAAGDMRTGTKSMADADALGQISGQLTILCSADGYTPSYALSVIAPQSQRRWVVLLGLTGQAIVAADDKQLRSLLFIRSWQPPSDFSPAGRAQEQADAR